MKRELDGHFRHSVRLHQAGLYVGDPLVRVPFVLSKQSNSNTNITSSKEDSDSAITLVGRYCRSQREALSSTGSAWGSPRSTACFSVHRLGNASGISELRRRFSLIVAACIHDARLNVRKCRGLL
jgi:hypothetical protein